MARGRPDWRARKDYPLSLRPAKSVSPAAVGRQQSRQIGTAQPISSGPTSTSGTGRAAATGVGRVGGGRRSPAPVNTPKRSITRCVQPAEL